MNAVARWNGTAWSTTASGVTTQLNSIWGSDASNLYAVGDRGTLLKWNGTSWSPQVSGSSQVLNAVFGSGNLFAVGNTGSILHRAP